MFLRFFSTSGIVKEYFSTASYKNIHIVFINISLFSFIRWFHFLKVSMTKTGISWYKLLWFDVKEALFFFCMTSIKICHTPEISIFSFIFVINEFSQCYLIFKWWTLFLNVRIFQIFQITIKCYNTTNTR